MQERVTLPGIGGSGPEHWQSLWEIQDPTIRRFAPASWDQPDLSDWMAALDRAVDAASKPPVLIAHSLACLLVAHWAAGSTRKIAGAFLVAPPDSSRPSFPAEAASFASPPMRALPFRTVVLVSANDPYGSPDYALQMAATWRASIIEVGALGHINSASGLGAWPTGYALLTAFESGIGG